MAYSTITLPGDPLTIFGSGLPSGTSISGTLNFLNVANGGSSTSTSGSLSIQELGTTVPLQTFTGFTVSRSGTTYTLTSVDNSLGNRVVITYNTATPTVIPSIQVQQDLGLLGYATTFAATNGTAVTNQSGVTCFASGTLIRTTRGEVAVEDLRVGDMALTTSGKSRRIVWLGSSDIDIRLMDQPMAYQPIRIAADAFGQGAPHRDLTVSSGHALCVDMLDEVLVPAVVLVNGATITQLDEDHVTYWHVELDAHDILYANGLPTESYIDVGNRGFFGIADSGSAAHTLADYCRPYVADGVLVEAMRHQLKLRAQKLGWSLEGSSVADLHLVADGTRVEPSMNGMTARFDVPASAREVWLVSNASVPAHVSDNADRRELGVRLQGLRIGSRNVAIDDPSLCVGFHTVEGTGAAIQRWTAGRARLPASLWAGARGDVAIALELVGPALPRWVAPADREAEPKRDGSHLSLVAAA